MNLRAPAAILSVCALWLYVFWQIRLEWIVNPMYAYGWTIPFLAGYLFYERWQSRPTSPSDSSPSGWRFLPLAIAVLALIPIRVVQEANPDWVKINWALLGVCCAATYAYFWAIGGIKHVFHFLFPIAFTFTAVPWPYNLELQIIQGLMQINAAFSADFMTIVMGIPSRAEGNLVEVRGQWVNVEEACSGVRSLQTAFMMALFFGEFHNLGKRQPMPRWGYILVAVVGGGAVLYAVKQSSLLTLGITIMLVALILGFTKRLVLVFASFLLAFLLNVVRTSILTYLSGTKGGEAVEEWHDPLGYGILFFCIGGLWLLAEWIKEKPRKDATKQESLSASAISKKTPIPKLAISLSLLVGIVAIEASTEAWYRPNDITSKDALEWEVEWPAESPNFIEHEMAERTYALLKYNEYTSASWTTEKAAWSAYYIRWYPGRTSKFLAGAHYPTVCLPASGLELEKQFDITTLTPFEDLQLDFNTFLFQRGNGSRVYVFHCLIEDGETKSDEEVSYKQVSSDERLESVRKGYRNRGQRVVGVLIEGAATLYDARQEFRQRFNRYTRLN